jgi:ribosomal-protein-alanine N-acetyltransferase
MDEILTPRLRLRLMSTQFLEASLRNNSASAEDLIGLKIPWECFQEKAIMTRRLRDCRSDPAYEPWSLRAIGLSASGVMIGRIGFHTRPNPDYLREFVTDGVELGYGVFSAYRRQGFAQEAIQGMLHWAATQHGVSRFVVSISPTNDASMALARKLGFARIGGHQDEVDGFEEVYSLSGEALERFLARPKLPEDGSPARDWDSPPKSSG